MKPRSLILILVIAALTGAAVWYFNKPAAVAPPPKTAEAPKTVAPAAAAPKTAPAQIEAPKAQPAPKPLQTPTPAEPTTPVAAKGDPQGELNTAIDDITSLLQAGNFMALFDKYASPDDKAKMSPEEKAQMEQEMSQMATDPEGQMMIQMMTAGFLSIKDQTPQMNAAGDVATYQMTINIPAGMGPPGGGAQTEPMTFQKVDGKWYIKDGPM